MMCFKNGSAVFASCVAVLFFFGCKSTEPVSKSGSNLEQEPAEVASIGEQSSGDLPEMVPEEEPESVEESLQENADSSSTQARSIEEQAKRFGAVAEKIPNSPQWALVKGSTKLVVKEDSRMAVLDEVNIWLDSPLTETKHGWSLGDSDESILLPWVFGDREPHSEVVTIVIDPGHGGSENGSRNKRLSLVEKDLNLDLSLRLQKHLDSLGFKTVLTRYDDRQVDLKKRPEIANAAKADLFISVHFNAASNKDAAGLETYMLTPAGQVSTGDTSVSESEELGFRGNQFDMQNFDLAYRIHRSMTTRLKRVDRGLKKARWAVLKGLECPGVLVECGFLSNESEAQLLSTAGYRERVALALAEAITAYAGREDLLDNS